MTKYDEDNIFAKIIAKEIPASVVFEDDFCLAFRDISPKKKEHVLVIPKGKYTSYDDFCERATEKEVAHFFKVITRIISDLGIKDTGYRLITNRGEDGGQEVPHFHVHILGGEKVGPMVCDS